jgi:hypothetical protein
MSNTADLMLCLKFSTIQNCTLIMRGIISEMIPTNVPLYRGHFKGAPGAAGSNLLWIAAAAYNTQANRIKK